MIVVKIDFCYLMGWYVFYIDNLIMKVVVDVCLEQCGDFLVCKLVVVIKYMYIGLGISGMVYYCIGNLRIEILMMQYVVFQRVNLCFVIGNKISIQ